VKVRELVELLLKQNQEADVCVSVGWSDDTAYSDDHSELRVEASAKSPEVTISGYQSNTTGELDVEPEDEEDQG
jgi:hypothetical protein